MQDAVWRRCPDRLPIVPTEILQRFRVHKAFDGRFSACARLLQSIWREKHNLEIGTHCGSHSEPRELGSRLSDKAARAGAGFLAPDIAKVVRREIAYREIGALIEEKRLWGNLLSSQGLTFNLFARAKQDKRYATRLFSGLLPNHMANVLGITFEHSPGRGQSDYLGDSTAFDVFVHGIAADGQASFVAIEVKYADRVSVRRESANRRYRELIKRFGLHIDPEALSLVSQSIGQFTAEHLLAALTCDQAGEDVRGAFMIIAPRDNLLVWKAINAYLATLVDDLKNPRVVAVTVETVIDTIGACGDPELAERLSERYTDFTPVHALIENWEPFADGLAATSVPLRAAKPHDA